MLIFKYEIFKPKQFDFVGIGDITNDAFIRVKEADVLCDVNNKNVKFV